MKKTLKFIVFTTLLLFSFNLSSVFGHGYHSDEEIQTEQRQDFVDEHTHY
jgi:hypothetical protein